MIKRKGVNNTKSKNTPKTSLSNGNNMNGEICSRQELHRSTGENPRRVLQVK